MIEFKIINIKKLIKNLKLKTKNFQKGFSLIEVVISMLMIAVILVLYASALNLATLSRKLRYENLAYHTANKQMETLRGMPYGGLPAAGVIADPMLAQIPSGTGDYTVELYPGHGSLKEIVVTVEWNDGIPKQIVLRTLSGIGGINR